MKTQPHPWFRRGRHRRLPEPIVSRGVRTRTLLIALLLLAMSLSASLLARTGHAGSSRTTMVPLHVANAHFETWRRLPATPEHWRLSQNMFPVGWTPDTYKKRSSTAWMGDSGGAGGKALYLDGQIVSSLVCKPLGSLQNRTLLVSLRARGEGGHIIVSMRGYRQKHLQQLVEIFHVTSTDKWQEYSAVYTMQYGRGVGPGRIQIEADGVLIDDIRVSDVSKKKQVDRAMVAPVPAVAGSTAPVVDGTMASGEWDTATQLTGFVNIMSHSIVVRQTRALLTCDGENLYICTQYRTGGTPLRAHVEKRDGPVWTDDAVEVFVGPLSQGGTRPSIYQFIINSGNVVHDQKLLISAGVQLEGWNCLGLKTASRVDDDVWTLEIKIPLKEVEIDLSKTGEFGLQICRDLMAPREFTSVSGGSYKDLFTCVYSPDAPAIACDIAGSIPRGELMLEMRVTNNRGTSETFSGEIELSTLAATRRAGQQLALPSKGEGVVSLNAQDLAVSTGAFSFSVKDGQGKDIFFQNVPIDAESAKRARPAASGKRSHVEWYPIQKKLTIRIKNVPSGKRHRYASAVIRVWEGSELIGERTVATPVWAEQDAHFAVPFSALSFTPRAGCEYEVRAVVLDEKGSVSTIVSDTFTQSGLAWLGNSLGRDAIVVPPFTPVRVAGSEISCLGRTHTVGACGLFERITVGGEEILSAPIRLLADFGKGAETEAIATAPDIKWTEQRVDQAQFVAKSALGRIKVEVKGRLEQDGMCRVEMTLDPQRPVTVNRLSLEIPLVANKYMHCVRDSMRKNSEWIELPTEDGLIWHSGMVKNATVFGTFVPFVWIGEESKGLCFFADSDRGWLNSEESPCYDIIRKGSETVLRVHFVAVRSTLSTRRTIVFGVQATPTKSTMTAPAHKFVMNDFGFDNPGLVQSWGGLVSRDLHLAKEILGPRKARGDTAHVYLCNDTCPQGETACKECYYEWVITPLRIYDQPLSGFKIRRFGPDTEDYIGFISCATPSRIDYNLFMLNKLFSADLSGLYVDNTFPRACKNIQHRGCGYIREDGILQAGYNLFATRELVKRAAILAHQRGGLRPHVSIHMTGAMVIPCFSFSGLCIDGEDHSQMSLDKDFMDLWPIERVAIMGSVQWGPAHGWLPKMHFSDGYKLDKPTRTMLAVLKLFDMWIWKAHSKVAVINAFEKIEKKHGLGRDDVEFLGYWENGELISCSSPDIKVSFYYRKDALVLAYVSNFSKTDGTAALTVDLASLGLANCVVRDAERGAVIPFKNNALTITVPKRDVKILAFTRK